MQLRNMNPLMLHCQQYQLLQRVTKHEGLQIPAPNLTELVAYKCLCTIFIMYLSNSLQLCFSMTVAGKLGTFNLSYGIQIEKNQGTFLLRQDFFGLRSQLWGQIYTCNNHTLFFHRQPDIRQHVSGCSVVIYNRYIIIYYITPC